MTGCAYFPQLVDVPLINHKNDLRIDAAVSANPSVQGTVTYGVTEKLALQIAGNYKSTDVNYLQGAVGCYKNKNKLVNELYAGIGYGLANAHNMVFPGELKGNYQVYFMQYNLGKVQNRILNSDFGLGIKVGYLHSDLLDQNYYSSFFEYPEYDHQIVRVLKDDNLLVESTLMYRFGFEKLKFNFKIGYCMLYKFTNRQISEDLPLFPLNMSFGFSF